MKRFGWSRIRKWVVIASLIGVAALLTSAWIVGGALVAPVNHAVGKPPGDFKAETVTFPSESGTTVVGWYLPVADPKGTVILLHPNRADRRAMLSRARLLRDRSYSTLLIDLQAHGESLGDNVTVGFLEKHDVLAAVKFVRSKNPGHKIGVIGNSLGGASALLAKPQIDVMVAESVYPDVSTAVHNRIQMRLGPLHHIIAPLLLIQLKPRLGISTNRLRPIDQLSDLNFPIMFASGDLDQHTTIEETREMFNTSNQPKKLIVFKGAEHEDLLAYDKGQYEVEIIGFIEEHMK